MDELLDADGGLGPIVTKLEAWTEGLIRLTPNLISAVLLCWSSTSSLAHSVIVSVGR